MRDGLGPYLGVFLKQHDFMESQIGLISTITSLCALLFAIPLGIFIDKTSHKKALIAFCILAIVFATLANYFYPHFGFTLLAQMSVALCGVCLAPAFAALTLGIVGLADYSRQVSLNEAYKHAGTAFSALLSLGFAFYYGIGAIFVITALMGVFSLLFLSLIRSSSINHKVARGQEGDTSISLWKALSDKSVLILGAAMFCFHLSNAYMLPLLSQRAHTLGIDSSGAYAAATILIAQSTMIVVPLVCMKILTRPHSLAVATCFSQVYFILMALCFVALIVRGGIAAHFENLIGMVATQILDGIGAGITGVILPVLVAIMLRGSGHINAALACVMTLGSIGAALSGSLGGFIAQYYGYFYAYIALSCVAFAGLLLWIVSFKILETQRRWG